MVGFQRLIQDQILPLKGKAAIEADWKHVFLLSNSNPRTWNIPYAELEWLTQTAEICGEASVRAASLETVDV